MSARPWLTIALLAAAMACGDRPPPGVGDTPDGPTSQVADSSQSVVSPVETIRTTFVVSTGDSVPLSSDDMCVPAEDRSALPTVLTPAVVPADLRERVALVVALERDLAGADESDAPELLMALGAIKSDLPVSYGGPIHAFGRMRSDYGLDEVNGEWLYSGRDFRELVTRFPTSDLADDAGYALSLLLRGGECEGFIPCYVSREWLPVVPFLTEYGGSPLVPLAIERALAAFEAIPPAADLRLSEEGMSPESFRRLAEALDSVARLLPQPRGNRLLERSAGVWSQLAEYDRARSALETALMTSTTVAIRDCLQEQILTLPR